MSEEVEGLKRKIKGIRAIILTKGRDPLLTEFTDANTKKLSHLLYYLINDIRKIHRFEGMVIEAKNGKFFAFNRNDFFLGILSEVETNFIFLKLLVRKVFPLEDPGKMPNTPPEEIPFFLRISVSNYYKKSLEQGSEDESR